MGFIKKIINKIPKDKKDHVLLGVIVGFPLILSLNYLGGLIAIGFVGFIEIWQGITKKGKPELWDFIASVIPIILFIIIKLVA